MPFPSQRNVYDFYCKNKGLLQADLMSSFTAIYPEFQGQDAKNTCNRIRALYKKVTNWKKQSLKEEEGKKNTTSSLN